MNLFLLQHEFQTGLFPTVFFTKYPLFLFFHLQIVPTSIQKQTIILKA